MKRIKLPETRLRFRAWDIISRAVEEGAALGVNRAYKHTNEPDREQIACAVEAAVLNALSEIIDFSPEEE